MNHTFKTRSALVRSAESGLRREQRRHENGKAVTNLAVTIIVAAVGTVLVYGLAHSFYVLFQAISIALGGGA